MLITLDDGRLVSLSDYNYISISYSYFGDYVFNYDLANENIDYGIKLSLEGCMGVLTSYDISRSLSRRDRVFSHIISKGNEVFYIINVNEIDRVSKLKEGIEIIFKNGSILEIPLQRGNLFYEYGRLYSVNNLCRSCLEDSLFIMMNNLDNFKIPYKDFLLCRVRKSSKGYESICYYSNKGNTTVKKSKGQTSFLIADERGLSVDIDIDCPLVYKMKSSDGILLVSSTKFDISKDSGGYSLIGEVDNFSNEHYLDFLDGSGFLEEVF